MKRFALIALPYSWLAALFLVPFLIVLKISLSDTALAIPPYVPTLDLSEGWAGLRGFLAELDFENFVFLARASRYEERLMGSRRGGSRLHGSCAVAVCRNPCRSSVATG